MTEPTPEPTATGGAPLTPGAAVHPLDPARDDEAAALLAPCTSEGTAAAARELLAAVRHDPDMTVTGLLAHGALVAVCVTRKVPMAIEVAHLAVAPGHRGHGHGRACLQDALRRAGKRPLVVETDEARLPFFRACGFKLVGRRKAADGSARYRLGWHAPSAHPSGPAGPVAVSVRPVGRTLAPDDR